MLPYFPFEQDAYALALGVRALRPEETLERQTVTRLPRTQAILFTIHTWRAVPPDMGGYKRLGPLLPPLLAYLER